MENEDIYKAASEHTEECNSHTPIATSNAFCAGAEWMKAQMQSEINELIEALKETRWIPIEDRTRPMPNDEPILIKDEDGRVYTWEEWDSYDQAPVVLITHWRPISTPKADRLLEKYGKK